MDARRALHLDIRTAIAVGNAVAFVPGFLFVLFVATFSRRGSRVFGAGSRIGSRRRSPSWDLPGNSCKTLEFEAALGPFPARLARPVEGSKACVDGSLVCLGTKLVGRRASRRTAVVDGAILPALRQQN